MTKEELLKPRVKCIADFWDNPFKVGEVIEFVIEFDYHDFLTGKLLGRDWQTEFLPKDNKGVTRYMYNMRAFTPYPHLFRKLEWWEERNVEDMPEYVKDSRGKVAKVKYEVSTFNGLNCYDIADDTFPYKWTHILPSTEQEYNDYLATKK